MEYGLRVYLQIKRSVCTLLTRHEPPFPENDQQQSMMEKQRMYHLKRIQLLFDLLSEHWGQTIAGGNFASSVVFAAGPCVVKVDTRTERYVSANGPSGSVRYTGRGPIRILLHTEKVLFAFNVN